MKIIIASVWSSPFLLQAYLFGRVSAGNSRSSAGRIGLLRLSFVILLLLAGLLFITVLSTRTNLQPVAGFDWLLFIWLFLGAVTFYVVGDDNNISGERTAKVNLGRWLSISVSAIALLFISLLLAGLLVQTVEALPRPPARQGDWWPLPWLKTAFGLGKAAKPHSLTKAGRRQELTSEAFMARKRAAERRRKAEIKRYLSSKPSPRPRRAASEPKSDPRRFHGWRLRPEDLAPRNTPGLVAVSSILLGDNMYETLYAQEKTTKDGAEAEDDSESGVRATLVITKQDSPDLAIEYLNTRAFQYGFSAATITVESVTSRVVFQGGYVGKIPVYRQAGIGWTSSLFAFEVLVDIPEGVTSDRAAIYGPAVTLAASTIRWAAPLLSADKPWP